MAKTNSVYQPQIIMRVRRRICWKEKTGIGYKKLKLQAAIHFWERVVKQMRISK